MSRAAWQRMNASALSPRDLTALSSHGGWETNIHNVCTLKLPEQAALSLAQLSTPQLRVLAAYSGLQSADAPRPVLLGSLGGALSTEGKQQWVVQNAEGTAPGRMKGLFVSYKQDLYLYGGMPHTAFTAARALNATSFAYPDNEGIFMKLCHGSGKWQSVSCAGAVPESRTRIHSGHAGVVHGDTLFLVGNLQSSNPEERPVLPTSIAMCQYHFPTQNWTRVRVRGAPEICHYPLLAAHQDQLVLFGGQTSLYENIGRHEALWSFDITTSAWKQQHASGDLPEPHLACALAVVNNQAYVLANDPEGTRRLEVYELDLSSWVWRRLPAVGTQPSCRRAASAVVVQGQWLLYGGLWTGEAYNSFHVFDFDKLAWSSPKLAGTAAHARYYHMAACHNNTMVILGGLDYMRPEYERLHEVDAVQCIWQQPAPHSRDFDDSNLMNHQVGPSMQAMYRQRLFTDATIVVEGIALHAHRAVLAAASPVFERMFSSHMQEGKSQTIEMSDVAAETVELLLQFIYGCLQQHDLTLPEAVALFQACLDYIESLQELEGILGSDTCSKIRNDPRLTNLLLSHQSGNIGPDEVSMERQHSASTLSVTHAAGNTLYRKTT